MSTSGILELAVFGFFAILVLYAMFTTVRVVPQQSAWIIERLGRYDRTLLGGLQILTPFIDSVRAELDLREQAVTIPEQDCITKDNVMVHVDGILYFKIIDPERATYGISNLRFAIEQLAQTTLRSEIGKIELDHTFEERPHINANVVTEIDKASEAWGVKVLRYEIKTIRPPADILEAMEKQMRAEREKRAAVLQSEGQRASAINVSEGQRESQIIRAEGEKQQLIKEAEGRAAAIRTVADATAAGIRAIADSIQSPGGLEAVQYRVATDYVAQFGNLARETNTLILPSNFSDIGGMIAAAMTVIKHSNGGPSAGAAPRPVAAASPATTTSLTSPPETPRHG
ncbi:MAG TPA: stomatin-like protein [Candidatus Binataceae bacterium]|nr:stomatin-like protein [Candidatus Binataceae bacterium]